MSPSAFESLLPSGSPDQRVVGEDRGRLAPEEASQPDLGRRRGEQVAAADHEVDRLAQVVDDDREPVRPVPVAIADRQVAGTRGDLVRARPDDGIHPALRTATERDAQDRPVQPAIPAVARTAGSVPQASVLVRPRLERRARAVAAIDEDLGAEPLDGRQVRRVVVRLAIGAVVGDEPQPIQVLEQRDLVLRAAARPVVVLDAQEDPPVGRARDAPGPDRVRHVTEVQESGRCRCEAGPRPTGERSDVSRRRPLRHPVGVRPCAVPIARLERTRGDHQPAVERQQVRLAEWPLVGHRHPQEHLALALGVADRSTAGGTLGPARLAGQFGALVEHRDEAAVEGVDPLAQSAQLDGLEVPRRVRVIRHLRHRTVGRSIRGPGDSRAPPGRRSTRARCRAGS